MRVVVSCQADPAFGLAPGGGHGVLGSPGRGVTSLTRLSVSPQNCQTFSSLSCLSAGTEDRGPRSPFALHVGSTRSWTALLAASGPGGRTPAGTPVPEPPPPSFDEHLACKEELCGEESDGCTLDEGWRDRGATGGSPCSLDGELDIEQIENN